MDDKGSSSQRLEKYNPEKIKVMIANYFIQCELTFRLVEHPIFIELPGTLEPRYTLLS